MLMDQSPKHNLSLKLQNEINSSGDIDQILLEWDGSETESRSWKIFMGHTSKGSYTSTTDWVSSSGLTQVFNGTVSLAGIGSSYFVTITLDTNFSYNNSDNLIIAIRQTIIIAMMMMLLLMMMLMVMVMAMKMMMTTTMMMILIMMLCFTVL